VTPPTYTEPTGDGRIYLGDVNSGTIRYLDGSGALFTLLDDPGIAPFHFSGPPIRDFIYDKGTNALITAHDWGPINPDFISVFKIPLSADGSKVSGSPASVEFDVSGSAEKTCGFSRGPRGTLLLIVDTNSNNQEGRMVLVDPQSLSVSTFASNGSYTGAAATNAGTFSHDRNEALILDTFYINLRAFEEGEAGSGDIIASQGLSGNGGSGDFARMIAIGGTYPNFGLGVDLQDAPLAGGSQKLFLDAGTVQAGRTYLLVGSVTGWTPGTTVGGGGAVVPVNRDQYTNFLLASPNTLILNSFGTLDVNGRSTAEFVVPNGLPPTFTITLYHAFVLLQPVDFASNPAILNVAP